MNIIITLGYIFILSGMWSNSFSVLAGEVIVGESWSAIFCLSSQRKKVGTLSKHDCSSSQVANGYFAKCSICFMAKMGAVILKPPHVYN